MLWIFATLVAAAGQTARNAMQSSLTASLGTLGATQVRFIYGFPFAIVFLGLVAAAARTSVPGPTAAFVAYTSAGALAQIFATAGVIVVAAKPGADWSARNAKPVLFGVASGGLFALAAVGFRGGILALGDAP